MIYFTARCPIRVRDLFRADLAKRQWHLLGFLLSPAAALSEEQRTTKSGAYCSVSISQCGCGSNRCDKNETKLRRRSVDGVRFLGGAHAAVAGVHGPKMLFCSGDARCYVRSSCCYYSLSIT